MLLVSCPMVRADDPRLARTLTPLTRSFVAVFVLAMAACGRKATPQDCDLIVDRYVEIELQALKVTDPKVIEERKKEMRHDLSDDMKACPGKRITDSMIACVRGAQSNAELDK